MNNVASVISQPVFAMQGKTRLIRGGKEYFELLIRLINLATESIHLHTYIYDDDETGKMVADALIAAHKRNVQVYLMADGYASQVMSRRFIVTLRNAGLHVRLFQPLLKSKYFYFGRRLHHKIFVVDGKYSLVGGINISDRYNDMPGIPAWFDLALYNEGEISRQLCILCWKTWNGFPAKMGLTPCDNKPAAFDNTNGGDSKIEIRRNDWVRSKNEISASYLKMFREARSYIMIVCSYFLPGRAIRRALRQAVARGVKVTVVTAGISDVRIAKSAERWLYDWLLRNKIAVYEYQPVILHAKAAVCDGKWLTLGSYNINDLSAYASIELNLDVYDPQLAIQTKEMVVSIIRDDCKPVRMEGHWQTRNIAKQFLRWLSYKIIRAGLYLLTFYYKRRS